MRPLDVLLFKGGDGVSGMIGCCQKKITGEGGFSHAALVISSDLISDPTLTPGVLYTWEVTLSSSLNDGVKDIHGKSFLGVQARPLDLVAEAVFRNPKSKMAWLPLSEQLHFDQPVKGSQISIRQRANELFVSEYGKPYDTPISLLSALFPCFRKCCNTAGTDRYFCSEFVAEMLKQLGVLPESVQAQFAVPVDFVPNVDTDHQINCCAEVCMLTSASDQK